MTKELHVVDAKTEEVLKRVDVSRRDAAEVEKTRTTMESELQPGEALRSVD
jgi:hypothetical protein